MTKDFFMANINGIVINAIEFAREKVRKIAEFTNSVRWQHSRPTAPRTTNERLSSLSNLDEHGPWNN
jgi:hypothetical protein